MNESKTIEKWSETQIKYARFLSRGKTTIMGVKKSNEEFAKANGVGVASLYRWKEQDGFMQMVFDLTMKDLVDDLPQMVRSVKAKVIGQEITGQVRDKDGKIKSVKLKPADTQAFLALMRQAKLLQSDKIETENRHTGEVAFTNQVFDADSPST